MFNYRREINWKLRHISDLRFWQHMSSVHLIYRAVSIEDAELKKSPEK